MRFLFVVWVFCLFLNKCLHAGNSSGQMHCVFWVVHPVLVNMIFQERLQGISSNLVETFNLAER